MFLKWSLHPLLVLFQTLKSEEMFQKCADLKVNDADLCFHSTDLSETSSSVSLCL